MTQHDFKYGSNMGSMGSSMIHGITPCLNLEQTFDLHEDGLGLLGEHVFTVKPILITGRSSYEIGNGIINFFSVHNGIRDPERREEKV